MQYENYGDIAMKKMLELVFVICLSAITLTSCGGKGGGTGTTGTATSAPTNVIATVGNGQVTISWNVVSGAASYNLYMASVSGVTKSNYSSLTDGMQYAGVTSPYTHSGLTNDMFYYFVVTAVNGYGESSESAQVSATKFTGVTGGCVLDNVTGLMWETKTIDYGLRDVNKKYTNYSPTFDPNGLYGTADDASGFVTAVNATNLCGFSDWRLPLVNELQSIASYSMADMLIYGTWFPYTPVGGGTLIYWSASPYVGNPLNSYAWSVFFNTYGFVSPVAPRVNSAYVRLVRTAQAQTSLRFTLSADGQEVTDSQTKLIWRRCTEGMNWNGATCAGVASNLSSDVSLQIATALASIGKTWRLPNVKELSSIADRSLINPAIDQTLFPVTPSNLFWWTATPDADFPWNSNWVVDFSSGGVYNGNQNASYVRLVRTSP